MTKQREIVAAEPPLDCRAGRGRIKTGTGIFQDHHFGKWPSCLPPKNEYRDGEYQYEAKDPEMMFDVKWTGHHWECKADGYGYLWQFGELGEYGNGCIFVCDPDGIEFVVPNA